MNHHSKTSRKAAKTQSRYLRLTTYHLLLAPRFRGLATIIILILILYPHSHSVFAQCPMCRMSAESNMANGGGAGRGLNTGILYLLVFPYLLAAVMIYLFRKNRKKLEQG